MNTFLSPRSVLFALVAACGAFSMAPLSAQTFTNLHNFTGAPNDGQNPISGVIFSGNKLYGTTIGGGTFDQGLMFSINADGTGYTKLRSLTSTEGSSPSAGVILSGGTLYGSAYSGGSQDSGTIFSLNTNGTGFTVLHHFAATAEAPDVFNSPTNHEGAGPRGLILSGGTLYGAATRGGSNGNGTVFKLNTNGTGYTVLHSFAALYRGFPTTNAEGAAPNSALLLSGNTLYGTATRGGSAANGVLFAVHTDGTGFTNLHQFTALAAGTDTNADGIYPEGQLVQSGSTLFGTTAQGGRFGSGVLFALNTNGTAYTIVHHFTRSPGYPFTTENSDGLNPIGGLLLSGQALYGKTANGGSNGWGAIFGLNLDGTGFTTLFNFKATVPPATTNATGYNPYGTLALANNTFYGTATDGGLPGLGTIFSLTLPARPALSLLRAGTNVILRWPTNVPGFTLQASTNLVFPLAWTNAAPAPVVVAGQSTVTNSILGAQKFFRLVK